jgi:hypothetical protein
LPLLAFTLERLYTDFGREGKLTLTEYEKLGGKALLAMATGIPLSIPLSVVSGVLKRAWPPPLNDRERPRQNGRKFDRQHTDHHYLARGNRKIKSCLFAKPMKT